jgi:hypothetical protein
MAAGAITPLNIVAGCYADPGQPGAATRRSRSPWCGSWHETPSAGAVMEASESCAVAVGTGRGQRVRVLAIS